MSRLSGPSIAPRGGAARQLVVLLHGVGADGADLIELAPGLAEHLPQAAFVAPAAPQPCDMAPFGRRGSRCATAGRTRFCSACRRSPR
jgi:phospholipase/carboxylesterase